MLLQCKRLILASNLFNMRIQCSIESYPMYGLLFLEVKQGTIIDYNRI